MHNMEGKLVPLLSVCCYIIPIHTHTHTRVMPLPPGMSASNCASSAVVVNQNFLLTEKVQLRNVALSVCALETCALKEWTECLHLLVFFSTLYLLLLVLLIINSPLKITKNTASIIPLFIVPRLLLELSYDSPL